MSDNYNTQETDTAQNEKLLARLRKVLALTASPVEGEAQAAAEMLTKLLTDHNLEIADLEQRSLIEKPGVSEGQHDLGKAAFKWKLNLADAVAEHCYCISLTDHALKHVRFAGRPENVESLRMLYSWLIDQIAAIAREERRSHIALTGEHIDPLRWQVNFGLGAVERLADRLRDKRRNEVDANSCSLVIHHTNEVNDYLESRYGYRKDGKRTQAQREREEAWKLQDAAMAELKQTDPEAYYAKRPWERPLSAIEQAAADKKAAKDNAKWDAKWRARMEREANRRRYVSPEQREAEEQGHSAKRAGRESADRINLQPFVGSGRADNAKRIV